MSSIDGLDIPDVMSDSGDDPIQLVSVKLPTLSGGRTVQVLCRAHINQSVDAFVANMKNIAPSTPVKPTPATAPPPPPPPPPSAGTDTKTTAAAAASPAASDAAADSGDSDEPTAPDAPPVNLLGALGTTTDYSGQRIWNGALFLSILLSYWHDLSLLAADGKPLPPRKYVYRIPFDSDTSATAVRHTRTAIRPDLDTTTNGSLLNFRGRRMCELGSGSGVAGITASQLVFGSSTATGGSGAATTANAGFVLLTDGSPHTVKYLLTPTVAAINKSHSVNSTDSKTTSSDRMQCGLMFWGDQKDMSAALARLPSSPSTGSGSGSGTGSGGFDVLIGSDLIYRVDCDKLIQALMITVSTLLSRTAESRFIMGHTLRSQSLEQFLEHLEMHATPLGLEIVLVDVSGAFDVLPSDSLREAMSQSVVMCMRWTTTAINNAKTGAATATAASAVAKK